MKKILILIISLVLVGCTKNTIIEKIELNRILNAVLKYESERSAFSKKHQFLINFKN